MKEMIKMHVIHSSPMWHSHEEIICAFVSDLISTDVEFGECLCKKEKMIMA
jgi:hypothetical protein